MLWETSVLVVTSILTAVSVLAMSESERYLQARNKLLSEEKSTFFGKNFDLSLKELMVDKILLKSKWEELVSAYKDSSKFLPSLHFFKAKEKIDQSEVFKLIKRIPKGASLHTHLTAAVSAEFLINNISYLDNLYQGYVNDVFKLKFLSSPKQDDRCDWTEVKELRKKSTNTIFDEKLKTEFILNVDNPEKVYPSVEVVWKKFKKIFTTTYDFYSYRPVFEKYIYQLLQELYSDNIMYAELKGTILPLYELDGTVHPKEKFFEIFIEIVNKFKKDYPKFVGIRYIHSIYRGVDTEVLKSGLQEIIEMKQQFPEFVAGFDFVGFEEEGKFLVDYHEEILEAQKHLKFFFHAGETNWYEHTDLNLADAILLNSSRIGHGFAIIKHPLLLKLAKERNIPLEICPVSNQVLMLNRDPRNHPATHLMALDYPLVICNDDPSAWNASGLSYDWYIAFMAMTPRSSGLEVLKKFALNSIIYSSVDEKVKQTMLEEWKSQWEEFLDEVLDDNSNNLG